MKIPCRYTDCESSIFLLKLFRKIQPILTTQKEEMMNKIAFHFEFRKNHTKLVFGAQTTQNFVHFSSEYFTHVLMPDIRFSKLPNSSTDKYFQHVLPRQELTRE